MRARYEHLRRRGDRPARGLWALRMPLGVGLYAGRRGRPGGRDDGLRPERDGVLAVALSRALEVGDGCAVACRAGRLDAGGRQLRGRGAADLNHGPRRHLSDVRRMVRLRAGRRPSLGRAEAPGNGDDCAARNAQNRKGSQRGRGAGPREPLRRVFRPWRVRRFCEPRCASRRTRAHAQGCRHNAALQGQVDDHPAGAGSRQWKFMETQDSRRLRGRAFLGGAHRPAPLVHFDSEAALRPGVRLLLLRRICEGCP